MNLTQILHIIILILLFLSIQIKSQITLLSPKQVKDQFQNDQIDFGIANFGFIPYGSEVKGNLTAFFNPDYKDDQGCEILPKRREQDKDFHFIIQLQNLYGDSYCSVYQQALIAQNAGYSMLIVLEPFTENLDEIDIDKDYEHEFKQQVNIPTIVIKDKDGQIILKELKQQHINKQKEGIQISVFFNPPNKKLVPVARLWIDPMETSDTYNLLVNMKEFMKNVNFNQNIITLDINYPLFHCYSCQNNNYKYQHPNCLGNGRYCSLDPDSSGPQDGADITRMKLQSICVYENASLEQWFNYSIQFIQEQCPEHTAKKLMECSEQIIKDQNINLLQIQKCYANSFTPSNEDAQYEQLENQKLEYNKVKWESETFNYYPSLLINGQLFKGDISLQNSTFEFICSGFTNEPGVCKIWDNWKYGQKTPDIKSYTNHFYDFQYIYGLLFLVIILLIIALLICQYQRIKQQMHTGFQKQVNDEMAEYFKLQQKTLQDSQNL